MGELTLPDDDGGFMADPACFIAPFGICISQVNAVSGAFITAVASLIATLMKIWSDTSERSKTHKFLREEREAREAFKRDFESSVKLANYREESWHRVRTRLDEATGHLKETTSRLEKLVEDGPHFDDMRMVKETAEVLDVFGDFQTSVVHFTLPPRLAEAATDLISHYTTVLLTLSPLKEVRQSEERRLLLAPLKVGVTQRSKGFQDLCAEFERDPSKFFPPP
jgi:hypothetical protein